MVAPWLQYEAYDIKFINNIVHDTDGAAVGVNGGYNILLAYNTFYRVGQRSHGLEVVFGLRSCDRDTAKCSVNRNNGGWGPVSTSTEEPIPDFSITIANNVLYNPVGYQSEWQHFAIYSPQSASPASNIPSPVKTDTNLIINGNLIWNGPANLPLGIDDGVCVENSNPTCNAVQLTNNNKINQLSTMSAPYLKNPATGDYRPVSGGSIMNTRSYNIQNFSDQGRPASVPTGDLNNLVNMDFSGKARSRNGPPGAYAKVNSPKNRPYMNKLICNNALTYAQNQCPYYSSNCDTAGASCGSGKTCFSVKCY